MPWCDIYDGLATDKGWGPEQVGRLTQYQALVYLGARDRDFGGSRRPSTSEELAAYAARHGMDRHGV